MTRNTALAGETVPRLVAEGLPAVLHGRSLVLVGLMGAGKSSIGRRVAARLGLPFRDADEEIEAAAGCSIADLFAQHGESAFRDGERRVIRRLLAGAPCVLATGGGAFMDAATRAAIRERGVSCWLRARLAVLVRRTAHRSHRPLLRGQDPEQVLGRLMAERHPVYATADLVVECGEDSPDITTQRVLHALRHHAPPARVQVALEERAYPILIGGGLLARAGAHLAPLLPQPRVAIVSDAAVAELYLPTLEAGLAEAGIEIVARQIMAPGEASKSLRVYGQVCEALLAAGVERRTAVLALGGGVVGDLAGFAAATLLRGVPFVQIPTTLLAQVDSSVGGKTGINTGSGKNLLGAFHQPLAVLADTATLATLPPRELRAGYAEIVKAGLIGDADFFAWCEAHGGAVLAGDAAAQAEAVRRACEFKAAVVAADERETASQGGRALLNLGHSFAHALEAECGYDGSLLHGEAVALGLVLAFRLSVLLEHCDEAEAARVAAHVAACGLPVAIRALPREMTAERLMVHMQRDKKMRDGVMTFVLARRIGAAFTSRDVPPAAVVAVLRESGAG